MVRCYTWMGPEEVVIEVARIKDSAAQEGETPIIALEERLRQIRDEGF
jgi:hypothetical protein